MNKTDFRFNSFTIGELAVNPNNINGVGGKLNPKLSFYVELKLRKLDEQYIQQSRVPKFLIKTIWAELFVGNKSEKITNSLTIYTEINYYRDRLNSTGFRVEFPLDYHKINFIEVSRENDVRIKLELRFQVAIFEPILIAVDNRISEQRNFITDFQTIIEDLNIEIPQSYWVKNVLPSLGFGDFFLIEIPKGNQTLSEAWNYVNKAENALRNWDSKGVFANCRELGKLLDGQIQKKFGKTSFAYNQRWQKRYKNFNEFASLDLHLEEIKSKSTNYNLDEIKTYKSDCENMILSSKVIIKYAEELLNE